MMSGSFGASPPSAHELTLENIYLEVQPACLALFAELCVSWHRVLFVFELPVAPATSAAVGNAESLAGSAQIPE